MTLNQVAQNILDNALTLKPSGTIEGALNTLDNQEHALVNLAARVGRREEQIESLSQALSQGADTVETSSLDEQEGPLKRLLSDIKDFLNTAIPTIKELNTRAKAQNDSLRTAIQTFINGNRDKLDTSEVPAGVTQEAWATA